MRKNNIRLCGLQEGVEIDNLMGYLTELFTTWAGSECDTVISIVLAYRMGARKKNRYPRNILIKFPKWSVKAQILSIFLEQPDLKVGGSRLHIFPDLSSITLKKRRDFKFLTIVLVTHKIKYRCGFPFTLIAQIGGKALTISTLQAAKDLYAKL